MKDFTSITVLLDRSGSMHDIQKDVVGGFNNFVTEQKEAGENADLTLIQFDTEATEIVINAQPIRTVGPLTNYVPRGGTPLRDALGFALVTTGERLAALPEADRPDKVVFVIITDGEENSSHEYSQDRIKEMVKEQEEKYGWQFIYIGANVDAFDQAAQVQIRGAMAASYQATGQSMNAAYGAVSSNVRKYRGSGQSVDLAFTKKQRDDLNKKDTTTGD